jgi:hypothetical protein
MQGNRSSSCAIALAQFGSHAGRLVFVDHAVLSCHACVFPATSVFRKIVSGLEDQSEYCELRGRMLGGHRFSSGLGVRDPLGSAVRTLRTVCNLGASDTKGDAWPWQFAQATGGLAY